MTIHVRVDDLSSAEVRALVAEHLEGMRANSPACHVNAMEIDRLRTKDITFFTAWIDGALCGCGAMRELDATTGEVKSMRTRATYLRRGVGQAVLDAIQQLARQRGYRSLVLETGTGAAFDAAHALYLRNGFAWRPVFGIYEQTSFSVFMQKDLSGTPSL
jgi:putative acetyltransferase